MPADISGSLAHNLSILSEMSFSSWSDDSVAGAVGAGLLDSSRRSFCSLSMLLLSDFKELSYFCMDVDILVKAVLEGGGVVEAEVSNSERCLISESSPFREFSLSNM